MILAAFPPWGAAASALYLPVGKVRHGFSQAYASGFLIGACDVLTVRHASRSGRSILGSRLRFEIRAPNAVSLSSEGKVIASGSFDPADRTLRRMDRDWLVLRLKHCLGTKLGYFDLPKPVSDREMAGQFLADGLSVAGFPGYRPIESGPRMATECRATAFDARKFFHTCPSLPGSSGSPVFRVENGKLIAIGINAAIAPQFGAASIAVRTDRVAFDVESQLLGAPGNSAELR